MVMISPADRAIVRDEKIKPFDRRGEVVWADAFESGFAVWDSDVQGAGGSVEWVASRAYLGGFCAKMTSGSTGAYNASLQHMATFPPVLGRMGVECSFSFTDSIYGMYLYNDLYDGAQGISAAILFIRGSEQLHYLGSDSNFHLFASGVKLYRHTYLFHVMKLVVDYEKVRYVRAIVDDTEYNLSAYIPLTVAGATEDPHMRLRCMQVGALTYNYVNYMGHGIITHNEP